MGYTVFVDGQEGTTGLQIHERLAARRDIEVLRISADKRKDADERRKLLNAADVAFLCLPDEAAKESVALVSNERTKIIDASTAHRIAENWVYGIPELSPAQRERIASSKRVSVPGCFASGFIMLLQPLVAGGLVPPSYPVTCHAVSGYSGGGKKLIEAYETPESAKALASPQMYGLTMAHKHIPEMQMVSGLDHAPLFCPIVSSYYQGMTVALPLHTRLLHKEANAEAIHRFLASHYDGCRFVRVMPLGVEKDLPRGYLGAEGVNGTNGIELFVFGGEERVLLVARLDNLGKGASGAAVQNMNIMLGLAEDEGLL